MAQIDYAFLDIHKSILLEGAEYENKNRGVERLQIPSATIRHDLTKSFPAFSLRQLYWKGVVAELIWFLRGDSDITFLNENKVSIWNKDAYNWYEKSCKNADGTYHTAPLDFESFSKIGRGSVGRNYGVQWRDFNGEVDQVKQLIDNMKKDIMSSRLLVTAWNPSELEKTALPACHTGFQIIGVPLSDGDFGFELHWSQRSTDFLLGAPFNVSSYALLATILQTMTGYRALAIEGNLKCVHLYDNQYDEALKIVRTDPKQYQDSVFDCERLYTSDWLKVWQDTGDLDAALKVMKVSDFRFLGYESRKGEKVEMLAPKV